MAQVAKYIMNHPSYLGILSLLSAIAVAQDAILSGFEALASIAKRLDSHGVELVFASEPQKVYKAKRGKRLSNIVSKYDYRGGGNVMKSSMGELTDKVIIPRLP